MNEEKWGILVGIYVLSALPLMIKFFYYDVRKAAREKLYPGRVVDERQGDRLTKLSGIWCGGLVALLVAHEAGWSPEVAAITLFGGILSMPVVRFSLRRWAAGKPIAPQKHITLDTQSNSSISQKMHELQELRNDELITEEEYQKKKQQLLEKF